MLTGLIQSTNFAPNHHFTCALALLFDRKTETELIYYAR